MSTTLTHPPIFEHWDDVPAAPGATSPTMFDQADLVEGGQIQQLVDHTGISRLAVRDTARPLATLKHLDVIRLIDPFDQPFILRVIGMVKGDGRGRRVVTITLAPIEQDLRAGIVRDEQAGASPFLMLGAQDRTPLEIINSFVIPGLVRVGMTWIGVGNIAFTQRIIIPAAVRTSLGWMRAIEEKTGGEFYLDRDTQEINLVERINDHIEPIPLEINVNLDGIDQETGGATITTQVVPLGAVPAGSEEPATRRHAAWRITDIAGDTITVEAPRGGSGLVAKAGMWVGKGALANNGTIYEIEVSTAPGDLELEAGAGANFAIGQDIEIRELDGTPIIEIRDPDYRAWERTAENSDLRGERNYVRVPYGDEWPDGEPIEVTCRVNGTTSTSTTLAIDNLLPLDLVVPDDSVIYIAQIVGGHRIATGGTASGGAVTVTLAAAISASDNVECTLFLFPERVPDAWERGSTSFAYQRREVIGSDLSCQADGAQTVPLVRVDVKGLTNGDVINPGDELVRGALRQPIAGGVVAAGGGLATIELGVIIGGLTLGGSNITDNESFTLRKRTFPEPTDRGETYGIYIPQRRGTQTTVGGVTPVTPPITILHDPRLESLWYGCKITYLNGGSAANLKANPSGTGDIGTTALFLIEDPANTQLDVIRDPDRALPADETDVELRQMFPLDQTRRVKLGIAGTVLNDIQFRPGGFPAVALLWCMLYLGTDGEAPMVDGSWGTELDQFGLAALQAFGPQTGDEIELELRDTAQEPGVIVAHRKPEIGARANLFSQKLGINRIVRIRGLMWDPVHRRKPRILLQGRDQKLSSTLAGEA